MLRGASAALLFLMMSVSTGQSGAASTTPPNSGSRNLVTPVASGKPGAAPPAPFVVRHPTQAGKVSQTLSGNFVPSAPHSWIARGDKRYSLCSTTVRNTVACSPLVAASVMTDLELSTIAGKNGVTLLSFKPAPGSKRMSKALAQAGGKFMQRLGMMSAHLERRALSYAPLLGANAQRMGENPSLIGEGGSCTYDDFGGYDCEGGGGGGGGGGDCNGQCDFPGGNDNGDPPPPGSFDPSTGEGIDPNAAEVIIVGRPEQGTLEPPINWIAFPPAMPAPELVPLSNNLDAVVYIPAPCVPGPRFTFVCPPPVPGPFALPSAPRGSAWKWTWSDFQWCKVWNNCGPITNDGAQPAPPAVTPQEKYLKAMAMCEAEAKAHTEYCLAMQKFVTIEISNQCGANALANYQACELIATDALHNH